MAGASGPQLPLPHGKMDPDTKVGCWVLRPQAGTLLSWLLAGARSCGWKALPELVLTAGRIHPYKQQESDFVLKKSLFSC